MPIAGAPLGRIDRRPLNEIKGRGRLERIGAASSGTHEWKEKVDGRKKRE